jgi:hypothetical protein
MVGSPHVRPAASSYDVRMAGSNETLTELRSLQVILLAILAQQMLVPEFDPGLDERWAALHHPRAVPTLA